MCLWELLHLQPGVTALIGGGGKTTMMYTLAKELAKAGTVICTTTTRIFAPSHLPVLARTDRASLEQLRCICVGTPAQSGKLSSPVQSIAELSALADYVLVEADGSKGLPVKAHLPHEPVIPLEAGQTIVLAGASAFGRSVRDVVHRPEVFCQRTGLTMDTAVTPEAVASLLKAESLGTQVFINQAETQGLLDAAHCLAAALAYPVSAGALQRGEWICLS